MRKCILIGAVESSSIALDMLVKHGFSVDLVITVPAEKSQMHSDYRDLGEQAERLGLPFLRTLNVNAPETVERVRALAPDVIFVVGWSRLCGDDLRAAAKYGVIGYHPTQLPEMRGRAALAWTILLDRAETAGSLFWMDAGTDSGAIAAQHVFPLPPRVDLPALYALHMDALGAMLDDLLPKLRAGEIPSAVQDHSKATYLAHRTAADGLIDWAQTALEIDRLVRAVTRPYPGAFTDWNGRKLSIWACEPVDRPEWIAQVGQIFAYDDGLPLVRCGEGTTLRLSRYTVEEEGVETAPAIKGQPRLGRKSS